LVGGPIVKGNGVMRSLVVLLLGLVMGVLLCQICSGVSSRAQTVDGRGGGAAECSGKNGDVNVDMRYFPTIDPVFDAEPSWYWSATYMNCDPEDCAWVVNFDLGYAWDHAWFFFNYVRAVRCGSCTPRRS